MTELYCGCSDLPRDRRAFYQQATAIEYRVGLFSPPKGKVLRDWAEDKRKAASPMRAVWVAWQAFTHRASDIRKGFGLKLLPEESAINLGHFQHTAENLRVWTRIKEQAANVEAERILLETSAAFVPSSANKLALENFVKNWADLDPGMKLIWHPAGFWEREEAAELAASIGIILAIDPLVDVKESLPAGSEAYFQMLGRHGMLDSYSDDDMPRILDAASHYDEATVVFRTQASLADAARLARLAKGYVPNEEFAWDSDSDEDEDFEDFEDDEDFEDFEDEDEDD